MLTRAQLEVARNQRDAARKGAAHARKEAADTRRAEAQGRRATTLALARTVDAEADRDAARSARAIIERQRDAIAQKLERAEHDHLTGLPLRRLFDEQFAALITQAGAREQLVALTYFDLNRFKQINTALGEAVADRILEAVGAALSEVADQQNVVAGRQGGDEFVLAMRTTDPRRLEELLDRVKDSAFQKIVDAITKEPGAFPIVIKGQASPTDRARAHFHGITAGFDNASPTRPPTAVAGNLIRNANAGMRQAKLVWDLATLYDSICSSVERLRANHPELRLDNGLLDVCQRTQNPALLSLTNRVIDYHNKAMRLGSKLLQASPAIPWVQDLFEKIPEEPVDHLRTHGVAMAVDVAAVAVLRARHGFADLDVVFTKEIFAIHPDLATLVEQVRKHDYAAEPNASALGFRGKAGERLDEGNVYRGPETFVPILPGRLAISSGQIIDKGVTAPGLGF